MTDVALTTQIVQLRELKTEITALNATLKRFKSSQAALEQEILEQLDAMGNGTTGITTKAGTLSILETDMPVVKNWSLVYKYIVENNAFHLLHRRMSSAAFNEYLEMDEKIPGTTVFTKRSLGLTAPKKS